MRRIATLMLCLPLIGAGCSWSKTADVIIQSPTPAVSDEQTSPRLAFATSTINEETNLYKINEYFPVATSGREAARNAVNSAVNEYITTTTAAFKDYLKDAEQWYSGAKYTLDMGYTIPMNDDESKASILFEGYQFTGGAHGMPLFQTMVFDSYSGKRLTLSDVLKNDDDLKTLADLCRTKLKTLPAVTDMSDDDWLKQGTEPTADNYKYWYLSKDGLHVIFPPYQVAAYAAGHFDVAIPYSDLRGMLKPEILKMAE